MIRQTLVAVIGCVIFLVPMAYGENSDQSIQVMATDFQFSPHRWTVNAGQQVSLSLINHGVQEHEWVILKQGTEVVLPFDEDDEHKVFWEIEAGPGATKAEIFTAPHEPGVYSIVCGKPRHMERGMKATLIVQ